MHLSNELEIAITEFSNMGAEESGSPRWKGTVGKLFTPRPSQTEKRQHPHSKVKETKQSPRGSGESHKTAITDPITECEKSPEAHQNDSGEARRKGVFARAVKRRSSGKLSRIRDALFSPKKDANATRQRESTQNYMHSPQKGEPVSVSDLSSSVTASPHVSVNNKGRSSNALGSATSSDDDVDMEIPLSQKLRMGEEMALRPVHTPRSPRPMTKGTHMKSNVPVELSLSQKIKVGQAIMERKYEPRTVPSYDPSLLAADSLKTPRKVDLAAQESRPPHLPMKTALESKDSTAADETTKSPSTFRPKMDYGSTKSPSSSMHNHHSRRHRHRDPHPKSPSRQYDDSLNNPAGSSRDSATPRTRDRRSKKLSHSKSPGRSRDDCFSRSPGTHRLQVDTGSRERSGTKNEASPGSLHRRQRVRRMPPSSPDLDSSSPGPHKREPRRTRRRENVSKSAEDAGVVDDCEKPRSKSRETSSGHSRDGSVSLTERRSNMSSHHRARSGSAEPRRSSSPGSPDEHSGHRWTNRRQRREKLILEADKERPRSQDSSRYRQDPTAEILDVEEPVRPLPRKRSKSEDVSVTRRRQADELKKERQAGMHGAYGSMITDAPKTPTGPGHGVHHQKSADQKRNPSANGSQSTSLDMLPFLPLDVESTDNEKGEIKEDGSSGHRRNPPQRISSKASLEQRKEQQRAHAIRPAKHCGGSRRTEEDRDSTKNNEGRGSRSRSPNGHVPASLSTLVSPNSPSSTGKSRRPRLRMTSKDPSGAARGQRESCTSDDSNNLSWDSMTSSSLITSEHYSAINKMATHDFRSPLSPPTKQIAAPGNMDETTTPAKERKRSADELRHNLRRLENFNASMRSKSPSAIERSTHRRSLESCESESYCKEGSRQSSNHRRKTRERNISLKRKEAKVAPGKHGPPFECTTES